MLHLFRPKARRRLLLREVLRNFFYLILEASLAWVDLLKRSSEKVDLEIVVDSKLSVCQQCPCGHEEQWFPGVHQEEH